jgi:hypothetical protein
MDFMSKHRPKIDEKIKLAKKSGKLTATPKLKAKRSNIISTAKEPTDMFAKEGLSIIRTDDGVSLIIRRGKTRKDSKIVAEYSKSTFGPYVIKFFDKKLQDKIEKSLDVERILRRKRKPVRPQKQH